MSTEQIARFATVIGLIIGWLGVKEGPSQDELTAIIGAIVILGSTIYGYYRRWKKGDTNALGHRVL